MMRSPVVETIIASLLKVLEEAGARRGRRTESARRKGGRGWRGGRHLLDDDAATVLMFPASLFCEAMGPRAQGKGQMRRDTSCTSMSYSMHMHLGVILVIMNTTRMG